MSRNRFTFMKGNLLKDEMSVHLDDDDDDDDDILKSHNTIDGSCLWCSNMLTSLSLFCPIDTIPTSKIKPSNNSNRKKKNYLGTPLPETPIEVRRKRRLLEGLLEAEESMQNLNILNDTFIVDDYHGEIGEHELAEKYEMGELLGIGSTSTCHKCIERSTGRVFACKIIDKAYVESLWGGMLDQFYTEIDVLKSLHHPNIIHLYDVYYTVQKIYIVMELMEGGELFDYVVQKGTLTEEEASHIARMVTSALVYMHRKNIIHRDLKPENLLLTRIPTSPKEDIEVKIIDFGLSKHFRNDSSTTTQHEQIARTFLGTKGYLAPEMLQRQDYTRAVDAWALGVIIFVLLCGCLPFGQQDDDIENDLVPESLIRSKFTLQYPQWARNLSSSAKDLLSHLLDIDPKRRYTPEQALKHPWIVGETASRDIVLKSPGRIRFKSAESGGVILQAPEAIKSSFRIRAEAHAVQRIAPRRTRQLVRKTSI